MKKEIDAQKTSDLLNSLTRHAYALQGLLDTLEIGHFGATLSGARKEAGADDKEGSFWWMQNHYSDVSSLVLAANCLSETIKEYLVDLDESLPQVHQETGGKTV